VPGGEHVRHDGPGDQEVAEHVGGEQVAEAVWADLPEADWFGHEVRVDGAHADASVADQYVEAAEGCERADSSEFRVRRLIHDADLTVARR